MFWPDATDSKPATTVANCFTSFVRPFPTWIDSLAIDAVSIGWHPEAVASSDVANFELSCTARAQTRPNGLVTGILSSRLLVEGGGILPGGPCCRVATTSGSRRSASGFGETLGGNARRAGPVARGAVRDCVSYHLRPASPPNVTHWTKTPLWQRCTASAGPEQRSRRGHSGCITRVRPHSSGNWGSPPAGNPRGLRAAFANERSHRPVIDAPPPAPSDFLSLIGRQNELLALQTAWQRVGSEASRVLLVSGEAGIGKSRLVEEFIAWAKQQGAVTASTRAYAAEGQLSLAPVTDGPRSDSFQPHLARLDQVWLTEVTRLLPELTAAFPNLPHPGPISEFGQRQRFFEALARAVLAGLGTAAARDRRPAVVRSGDLRVAPFPAALRPQRPADSRRDHSFGRSLSTASPQHPASVSS